MQSGTAQHSPSQQQISNLEKVVEPSDSLSYGIYLFDKKIRNLEKKKTKIEKHAKDRKQGKELNDDQIQAINRLDETIAALIATRDIKKQFEDTVEEVAKSHKKHTKKAIHTEKESRRLYLKEIFTMKAILHCIVKYPELQKLLIVQNEILRSDDHKSRTVLKEINEIASILQDSPQRWLADASDDENEETVNRLFSLIEGKSKPISNTCDVTYLQAKTAIMAINDAIKEYITTFVKGSCKASRNASTSSQHNDQSSDGYPKIQTDHLSNQNDIIIHDRISQISLDTAAQSDTSKPVQQVNVEKKEEKSKPASAIKSITFTNRNFPSHQHVNPGFSYDQMMYDQMDMVDPELIEQGSIHSPVTFVSSGGYESRQPLAHAPSQGSHVMTNNEDVGYFVPMHQAQFQQQQNMRYPQANVYATDQQPAQMMNQMQRQIPFNATAHHQQPQQSQQQQMRYQQPIAAGRPQYDQKGFRRERAQRPAGSYQRPTFANRSQIHNDDQPRRASQFAQRSSAQPGTQNY
ncbi:hypothetical protein GJ496_005438 [Pomphorhynchus laevis]|nr:hypothetical protein GJ496_005438 [Pomphorhynchus laevis]